MTRTVAAGLLMMIAWAAMTGSITPPNLLLGLVLGALCLFVVREQPTTGIRALRLLPLLRLVLLFLKELAVSALQVALLVMRPNMHLKPGIFAYNLTVTSDFEIMLLANLITLTPGTLSVDVSSDRKVLYVHALDCANPTATRKSIAEGFERRIKEAFAR
ncbi:Na+/H+ antiporter subunit E [Pararhizobium sp.]|uniref:Na+/H+ antiporter subunit E n=1 Tax=Pararhizobium sp. TaxID=1977563 RepID=UPI00271DF05B|nr:Na+/H+ antiporter subunit E [Pararhizobium sp.]MDO9417310.1 Na+/H+ antiporter subunit E [Pararhizobium sp.]